MFSPKILVKMSYTIFSTGACNVHCVICAIKGQPNFNFYHFGHSEQENKAIINFIKMIGGEKIGITGGNPLRNISFLRMVILHHNGKKSIQINPISFLSFELGKPANRINEEEAINVVNNIKQNGFSSETKKIIKILSEFDSIGLSMGNLQSPYPQLMKYAKELWEQNISQYMKKTVNQDVNAIFENSKIKSCTHELRCVGNIRSIIEKGEPFFLNPQKSVKIFPKNKPCSKIDKSENYVYFRRTSKGIKLFLLGCCNVGLNPYIAYETNLTIEDISKIDVKELKCRFEEEKSKMMNSAFYTLLNRPDYDDNFKRYVFLAEKLIRLKTGEGVNIVNNTFAFCKECDYCEVCNTIGVMLHRANIEINEWQEFLEESRKHPSNNR